MLVCVGQTTAKQQFQITLVSCTDPINVWLVNKDSDTDKPTVTRVPPFRDESSSPAQVVPGSSGPDDSVTMPTTSAPAVTS